MAVSKIELANGQTLIDLTNDTVTAETLAEGITAHGADGEPIVGTMRSSEDLNAVLTEQEALIDELKEVLREKASGGGGGTDNSINAFFAGTLEEIDCDEATIINPYAFDANKGIKRVRFANVTEIGAYNFRECDALESVDLPNVTGTVGNGFCQGCENLTSVNVPNATEFGNYSFQSSPKIEKLDLPSVEAFGNYCLRYTTALKTLILRHSGGVVARGSSVIASSGIASKKGYIYVPAALIEDYKNSTGWSNYADQFRAIEDYPEICGGEA